jgi:circadian clock protein KaiB
MLQKILENSQIKEEVEGKAEVEITQESKYILKLFVATNLPDSALSISNAKLICEQYLKGMYELEIIDIYKYPDLTVEENIIAVPVLIKKFPLPEVRVIGDLSDVQKVLKGFHFN